MKEISIIQAVREVFAGRTLQILAFCFCVVLGLGIIANVQLGGEASWFWYTTLFHQGAKLYADLHLALQPLFVLEMNAWMNLFGRKLLVTETPSVIHLVLVCVGLLLLLRESDWPDWQRAIMLASVFVLWVSGTSYRFDDYHVTTEIFVLYSIVLLLLLARAEAPRRQLALTLLLGVLCGFTIATRLNDGGALLVAGSICLLFLAPTRKSLLLGLYVATAALTVILVVKATGDSFSSYLSNSVLKVSGTKGGTGSLLADPALLLLHVFSIPVQREWMLPGLALAFAAGVISFRYWRKTLASVVLVELGVCAAAFLLTSPVRQKALLTGILGQFFVLVLIVASYVAAVALFAQFLMWKPGRGESGWDKREVLLLIPLALLASISTSAAANPLFGYYSQLAMMLLLCAVLQPFRKQVAWANGSLLTMLLLLTFTGASAKICIPYYWNNEGGSRMFTDREWYRHPVYGPMYIDREQLQFIQSICADVSPGGAKPELLSLPFSFPNYFCDAPPWHGYVQTFFDTSTRATIERLLSDLNTDPPQWIVYQRQLGSLAVHEQVFNHGQRLAQRDVDELLMQRIASGQWTLVDKKDYGTGDGWYVIRTWP